MINIGIDVGKFKHCASVMDDKTGEILIKPFFFNALFKDLVDI